MDDRVLVLGGDGFCGWPTCLRLSEIGYTVTIIDSLVRRLADEELECESLTPIQPIEERIKAWHDVSGRRIHYKRLDIARNYIGFKSILEKLQPKAIVHFAEQRSAPYSMKSDAHKRLTVSNNINATNNVLCALVATGVDAHLIHLGTAGVYGYGSIDMELPEGYLSCKVGEQEFDMLYPSDPGSVYHMSKCMDATMFQFFAKNDGLRITDLHQGIVWGTETDETRRDERLINRFDYDGDYGTVLNRFLMQAAIGHPLTVYGSGGQTRAFININDTVNCIVLALHDPPAVGEKVKIINQTTEQLQLLEVAQRVSRLTGAEIAFYSDPRVEAEANKLRMSNATLLEMGLDPITLEDGLMSEICKVAYTYKDRCDKSKIAPTSFWRKGMSFDRLEVKDEKLEIPDKAACG